MDTIAPNENNNNNLNTNNINNSDTTIETSPIVANEKVESENSGNTVKQAPEIPVKEYQNLSPEELINDLKSLIKNHKIQDIKDAVEQIKTAFNTKFDQEVIEKQAVFINEGGNAIDFYYSTPAKKEFNSLYFDYKEKRNLHYQNLKKDLQANLKKRLEIIEELKSLPNLDQNTNTTYNQFKDLRERWGKAGNIPKDKYNTVWNTFYHHVENFYNFLHLNRDFRELDFKYNLEQKLKIIDRAKELTQETDINRAFRELQLLHKLWKEELGPVSKEYSDVIWEKFSELTKVIHDNRQAYYKDIEKIYEQNLEVKNKIIASIEALNTEPCERHNDWQKKHKEIESLREAFMKAGKVPRKFSDITWDAFKESVRVFNRNKNAFYKEVKKEQLENLDKKNALIKIAESNKDNEDINATLSVMKKVQADWKKIGPVPKKDSDAVWKAFKSACNHFFDRINDAKKEVSLEELANFEKKEKALASIKEVTLTGDTVADLETIKTHISNWKTLGRVPYEKKGIEKEFNTTLDELFEKLNLNRKEAELFKFENKLNSISALNDERALQNEHVFIRKKIDEISGEVRQLENNLEFFKHVDQNNPLVKEVYKNITKQKETMTLWKEKLKLLKKVTLA